MNLSRRAPLPSLASTPFSVFAAQTRAPKVTISGLEIVRRYGGLRRSDPAGAVASGNQEVIITSAGVKSPPGVFLMVQSNEVASSLKQDFQPELQLPRRVPL